MLNYIFDFDGTLADSEQCSILATQAAFEELKLTIPTEEQIRYFMGIPIEQSFKEMSDRELTDDRFTNLLTCFRRYYQKFENETLQLFPGIMDVLIQLQKEDKLCFVVSSKKSDVLLRNLQGLKIDRCFKDLIGSDKVSSYKPHPEGILLLIDQYGLYPENTVMIGDAIFDIQMGKAAGVKSCGVSWGSHEKAKMLAEQPDYFVNKPAELLEL